MFPNRLYPEIDPFSIGLKTRDYLSLIPASSPSVGRVTVQVVTCPVVAPSRARLGIPLSVLGPVLTLLARCEVLWTDSAPLVQSLHRRWPRPAGSMGSAQLRIRRVTPAHFPECWQTAGSKLTVRLLPT
jgi:hypothetical protein